MDAQLPGSRRFRPITTADGPTGLRLYAPISSDCGNIVADLPAVLAAADAVNVLLEINGQPAGMVLGQVRTSLSSGRHFVVDDLVVDSPSRRRGLGRALMEHVIAFARSIRCNLVELNCSQTKLDAHAFYESLGFRHRVRHYSLSLD
jgi:GNAT superfamily N-acetyltransferase